MAAPQNQEAFDAAMAEIDQELRDRQVAIPSRELLGAQAYVRRFSVPVWLSDNGPPEDKSGPFEGVDAGVRIREWFGRRYGDRLKIRPTVGSTILHLRGDLWLLKLPLVLGNVRLVAVRDLFADLGPKQRSDGIPVLVNVLSQVDKLSGLVAAQLTDQECDYVLRRAQSAMLMLDVISRMDDLRFAKEARADWDASAAHIMSEPVSFGQSKWSSLQAAEKWLKACLSSHSIAIPRTHSIAKLAGMVPPGIADFDSDLISAVEADPGVRYGELPVDGAQAYEAHFAALQVGFRASHNIRR